jgi:hypothetical protein
MHACVHTYIYAYNESGLHKYKYIHTHVYFTQAAKLRSILSSEERSEEKNVAWNAAVYMRTYIYTYIQKHIYAHTYIRLFYTGYEATIDFKFQGRE